MKNIERLENLPFRESRGAYLTRKYGDMWNLSKFEYHKISEGSKDPYVIAIRLIMHYVNRSFDQAFAHYCMKVKQKDQCIFYDGLDEYKGEAFWRGYYYLDDDRIIRYEAPTCKYWRYKQSDKEYYEKLSKERKKKREYKLVKREWEDYALYYWTQKRKEKELKDNLLKIVKHGFDPQISFRNH